MKQKFTITEHRNLWLSADSHFSHSLFVRHKLRPFDSLHEMNKHLIDAWNSVVRKTDLVVHLGDFSWNDPEPFIKRLNGDILLVFGNHDHKARKKPELFFRTCDLLDLKITDMNEKKYHICCCHYAMRTWNKSHWGSFHTHGHSHGSLPPIGKQLDVGVDNAVKLLGEYRPFSFKEFLEIMNKAPATPTIDHHTREDIF